MAAVDADPDLSVEGKQRKRQQIGRKALAQQEQSVSLQKARDAVERQMQRWADPVAALIKPAKDEVEASLHAEVRRHVANLKDPRERMSFLEKNGVEPRLRGLSLSLLPLTLEAVSPPLIVLSG